MIPGGLSPSLSHDELRRRVTRRHAELKRLRDNRGVGPLIEDLTLHFRPLDASEERERTRSDSGKKKPRIIDNCGRLAVRDLGAGLMSGMTNPARPWVGLKVGSAALMETGAVKTWLSDSTKQILSIFESSNIYRLLPDIYEDLGVVGTSCLLLREDYSSVVWGELVPWGDYCIARDNRGQVNTLYRDLKMTVGQVVQEFGLAAVSQSVRSHYEAGRLDTQIDVVHAIEPNPDFKPDRKDGPSKRYLSVYIEQAAETAHVLATGGYDRFPAIVVRWRSVVGWSYGRPAALDALDDSRQLQVMHINLGQAVAKMINPPLVAAGQSKFGAVSTQPGAVNYTDALGGASGPQIVPLLTVRPDIAPMQSVMQDVRQRIDDALFRLLWRAVSQLDTVRTATEIEARKQEQMLLLGPVLDSLNKELLSPLIEWVWAAANEAGILPPPPEEIAGQALEVEFRSMLANAQKSVAVGSIERLAGFVGQMAQAFPEALMKIDPQQAVDEFADAIGAPVRMVRSDEDVAAIQQAQAQQQQQMQMMQMMQQGAQTAQTLSQSDMGGDNALSRISAALSGAGGNGNG